MEAAISELAEKGVSAEELERSKTRLIADSVYAQDSQSTLARWYGSALTTGLTVDSVRTWPERIRAVTADAVRDAARQWLNNQRSVTGYLVKNPQPQEKRSPEEKRS
jgi:zinc protease